MKGAQRQGREITGCPAADNGDSPRRAVFWVFDLLPLFKNRNLRDSLKSMETYQ